MDETIIIKIPCWNCGKFMKDFVHITESKGDYWECVNCKAGWEIIFHNNTLFFDPDKGK